MKLRISADLVLPLEAVTEKSAFLGRTGSGKTYAAQKLAEELDRAGAQFVALDPVGKWWSLRLAADGDSPGIPIPVFGGLHGDVPLEPTGGKLVADLVADRGISVVLDVSQFESDAAKNRFAADFGARFFFRRKGAPAAVHLFLEEAQEFVPQNPMGDGDKQVLHAFTQIWKLGRNFGIGGSLITQRPQEVNKKVLNLTEILFAFQLTGPHERKAVAEWIKEKGLDIDVEALLPKLRNGEPHVWSPALLNISKTIRVAEKRTYDASSTPKVGAKAEAQTLAPIDLEKIRKDMAATIERAKAEDPKELRRQLQERNAEIAKLRNSALSPCKDTRTVEKPVEIPILKDGQVQRLQQVTERWATVGERFAAAGERFTAAGDAYRTTSGELVTVAREILAAIRTATNGNKNAIPMPLVSRPPAPRVPVPRGVQPSAQGSLPEGERRVLTAVAQYPDGASREQLSILTGYKRSTRDRYLQLLQQKGYVEAGEAVIATSEGVAALGDVFAPLPTGDALLQYWLQRLPEGERRILEVVIAGYPDLVTREAISEATGYKRSTRDRYLQLLATRRMIKANRDGVRAVVELFEAAR